MCGVSECFGGGWNNVGQKYLAVAVNDTPLHSVEYPPNSICWLRVFPLGCKNPGHSLLSMSSLSLIGMGLGIDKQRRDKFVKHYNAFVEPGVKLKAPEIVLCDAPALLRKTAPPIPIQPLAVARRFLKNHLLPAAETLCIFFDTPEFHHEMRAAVAQARAAGCKITPYPEEEVVGWTLTSQIEVARAMARPAHKVYSSRTNWLFLSTDPRIQRIYYSLFYEALIQTIKQHLPETVQTVVIDGPRPNDDVVVLNLHPLSDDGRAKLTTWSEMRLANYGEADLKVAKWIAAQKDQLQGKVTEWRTIDTGQCWQPALLLGPVALTPLKTRLHRACCCGQFLTTFCSVCGFRHKERGLPSR